MARIRIGIDWTARELSQAGSSAVERAKWLFWGNEGIETLAVEQRRAEEDRGDEELTASPFQVPAMRRDINPSMKSH